MYKLVNSGDAKNGLNSLSPLFTSLYINIDVQAGEQWWC